MTTKIKKKLLVVGNGFDLACNMKTKFYDFMTSDFVSLCKKDTELFIKENFFFHLFDKLYFGDSDSVKRYQKFFGINEDTQWMDIENTLKVFFTNESIFKTFESGYKAIANKNDLTYFGFPLEDFYEAIKFSIQKEEIENPDFIVYLMIQLKYFENTLAAYMKIIDTSSFSKAKINLLSAICNGAKISSILTFNYTNMPYDLGKVTYIHGKATNGNAIVGIDYQTNKSANQNQSLLFTKTFRVLNSACNTNKSLETLPKKIDIISFYGHSLSDQDFSYFQSIFDFYSIYGSCIKLEFLYTNHDGINEDLNLKFNVFNLINKYARSIENEHKGRNLLHKMILENRIIFREIKKEEFIK